MSRAEDPDGADVVDEPDPEDLPTITVADPQGPAGRENVARCPECGTVLYPGDVRRGDVVECVGCHQLLEVGSVRRVGE